MGRVKFNSAYLTGEETAFLGQVFDRKQFYGAGEFSKRCEAQIAKILEVERVLLTDSCTSALEISALLLRDRDESQSVIIPSYTFTSTAAAFVRAGFRVIFCECDPSDMMIDVADAANRVEDDTVAIVGVHYGGLSADIVELQNLCSEKELILVEDAAQGFASKYDGRPLGSFGDLGCFSFHETKNLHCGLGGALVVNNPIFYERSRHILERGTNRQEVLKGVVDKYTWVEVGGSFYPTELQAAFLLAQLGSWQQNLQERNEIASTYHKRLAPLVDQGRFKLPLGRSLNQSNFHAVYLIFPSVDDCDGLRGFLSAKGVDAYIGYVPLHSSPVGLSLGNRPESLPVTELFAPRVLRLPLHNGMQSSDAFDVCKLIEEYFS